MNICMYVYSHIVGIKLGLCGWWLRPLPLSPSPISLCMFAHVYIVPVTFLPKNMCCRYLFYIKFKISNPCCKKTPVCFSNLRLSRPNSMKPNTEKLLLAFWVLPASRWPVCSLARTKPFLLPVQLALDGSPRLHQLQYPLTLDCPRLLRGRACNVTLVEKVSQVLI